MLEFDIEVDTFLLECCIKEAEAELAKGPMQAVEHACREGVNEAKRTHFYKDKTSALTNSIHAEPIVNLGGEATGFIVADAPYALFVEGGTVAHEIYPKAGHNSVGPLRKGQTRRSKTDIGTRRVALRWADSGGGIHFASVVHHPGTKADGFMMRGTWKAEMTLLQDCDELAARVKKILEH